MNPRRIIAGALLALFLWALCMGFIALFFNAMGREQAMLEGLRIERCEYQHTALDKTSYCKGIKNGKRKSG